MRFSMDLRASFKVIVETLLCVAAVSGASFGVRPLPRDNFRHPDYYPRAPDPPEYPGPEAAFAYTEVITPYYHYYFYAPAFKTSFLEDSTPEATGQVGYSPPYDTRRTPEYDLYNPLDTAGSGNEYYSPKFNEVGFSTHEMPVRRPKFRNNFLEKPYPTAFNRDELPHPFQNPSLNFTPPFLPTALSSGTPNIIRNDDEGRAVHGGIFRHQAYAPSYKGREPPSNFQPNPPPYKPLPPPLLSAAPNIIRDEVPAINRLFKPVLPPSHHQLPSSSTSPPPHPFTSQSAVHRAGPSLSPPASFATSDLPGYAAEETSSPVFTPSPTPLEGFPTAATQGPSENPKVLFEAPGHTVSA